MFTGDPGTFTHSVESIHQFSAPICSVCVFRYEIEEGLRRLHDVKPAGETYMHEGIKEVILQSTSLKLFTPTLPLLTLVICLEPEGHGSDQETGHQVLQHHPGSD